MMPRNLDRRVEVAFPVQDPKLVRFLHDQVLAVYLADVVKARLMKADGTYDRPSGRNNADSMNSQEWFIKKLTIPATDRSTDRWDNTDVNRQVRRMNRES
jgi:polyphosphate kinase